MPAELVVEIEYCTGCRWTLRVTSFSQELLGASESEFGSVTLQPGNDAIFEIWVNAIRIGSRKDEGSFFDIKLSKSWVRDQACTHARFESGR